MKILNPAYKLSNVFLESNSKNKIYGYTADAINKEKISDSFAVSAQEIRNAFITTGVNLFGIRMQESYFSH